MATKPTRTVVRDSTRPGTTISHPAGGSTDFFNQAVVTAIEAYGENFSRFHGGFINVKDTAYGATGDGVTDDTAAINLAITAAGVGGRVYFPKGTYIVTSALLPLAGQIWFGDGENAVTIIKQNTANTDAINVIDVGGISLRDFEVNGGSGTGNGLVLDSVTDSVSSVYGNNLRIRNCGQDALVLKGANDCNFTNAQLTNNGRDGLRVIGSALNGSSDNNDFFRVKCASNGGAGATVGIGVSNDCQNSSFYGLQCESNVGNGLDILGTSSALRFIRYHGEVNNIGININASGSGFSFYNPRTDANVSHGVAINAQAEFYSPMSDSNGGDTGGSDDDDCPFWKLSYCVYPILPSPTPILAPSPSATITTSPSPTPITYSEDTEWDCGLWSELNSLSTVISYTVCIIEK